MAVLYLDLDGFKEINNTLGHAAGDALLKMVAARLLSTVREEDTVARLGGDEFVIAAAARGADDASQVAAKVIEAVSQPYLIEGQAARITISAGVGLYPGHGEDADTLMRSADLALYEAKRAGKNAYRIAGYLRTSTVESCIQPRSSFLYQRITIPVLRSSGVRRTWIHSLSRPSTVRTVPRGTRTRTSAPDEDAMCTLA